MKDWFGSQAEVGKRQKPPLLRGLDLLSLVRFRICRIYSNSKPCDQGEGKGKGEREEGEP